MNHLRPHQVFDRVERTDCLARICLPRRYSLTSMLERAILSSLLKIIKPHTAFEFGTYLGETTLILAANTTAKIYSIDLDQSQMQKGIRTKLDKFELVNIRKRFSEEPVFKATEYEKRIETLAGDSTTYDFSPFYQEIDFVLIDGGHHVDVVASDSQQALKMLSLDRPACVLWHDYGNPHYRITDYLDELCRKFELWHVDETTYVFLMINVDEKIFPFSSMSICPQG